MNWDWAKANAMDVAKFATDDALKLFDLNFSSFDLRRDNKIEDLLKAIYDTLVLQNIQYELAKPSLCETHQRIRTPVEVLKTPRQGTCLDLALLFCGLCLGCNLLPKIVILEGHALVVVPIVKELCREDYRSNNHHQKEFIGRRKDAQGNPRIEPDTYKNKDQLIDLIDENIYRAIECTGFAYSKSMISGSTKLPSEFKRDEKGYLTFEQAKEEGRKQLDRLPFQYAVDIEVAHKEWGITPETFDIPGEWEKVPSSAVAMGSGAVAINGVIIFQIFTEAPRLLSDYIKIKQFKSLVDERTKNFVGREFIFQSIDNLITDADFSSGYIVISGEPGIGKSSLIAQLIKTRGAVHHFNNIGMNICSPKDFLENICAQLILRYQLNYSTLPPEAGKNSGFLSQLLAEIANQRQQQPVVILVDALDEAEDTGLPAGANRLFLPPNLPEGIFFIVTSREKYDYRLNVDQRKDIYLRDDDPRNLEDVRLYIRTYVQEHRTKMSHHIEQWGVSEDEFIDVITEKSEGNFMYLVYVLHDIRDGNLTQSNVDSIDDLPTGLEAYYKRHWREMEDKNPREFKLYYEPVVCQLAVAREPVSVDQLSEWTKLPQIDIKKVIRDWLEFFNEFTPETGKHLYHIYHASFQTFLREDVGLRPYEEKVVQTAFDKIQW